MPTYSQADAEANDLLTKATEAWHPDLKEHGVRIGLLFAHARRDEETGEPKGPALTHGGYPALAIVRIINLKDRVAGMPDAVVYLDHDQWPDMTEEKKLALLDHELEHLELVRDYDGAVALDDCNRPKLRMKKHEFYLGGFFTVSERHKDNAAEVQAFTELAGQFRQRLFWPQW